LKLKQQVRSAATHGYVEATTTAADSGFSNLGIAPNLLREIAKFDFINPTPIQTEAIPAGIRGEDIIAIARTGSGKTLAFGVPMLQRLAQSNKGTGLVLVPTRELAFQVDELLHPLIRATNRESAVIVGGAPIQPQIDALRRRPRVVIATPGRLVDHLERKTISLVDVEVFVLDEADRMLDMGFLPEIKRIMGRIPKNRQTMLFSATMPGEIEAIARNLMESPTRIEIDRSGTTPHEVSHEMFVIENPEKKLLLALQLKQRTGPTLVFTRTKHMAKKLTRSVNAMGFAAAEIHSDRSLRQRQSALAGFKRGAYRVLIATDIAARGIDVTGIELVVNYDMPANSEDYVHRIGRTGRAGMTGHAISFANASQKRSIRDIEKFMKTRLAVSRLPELPSEKKLLDEGRKLQPKIEQIEKAARPISKRTKNRPPKDGFSRKGSFAKFTRRRSKLR